MINEIMVIYRDTDRVTIGITEARFKKAFKTESSFYEMIDNIRDLACGQKVHLLLLKNY